jgi:hypothetical protein
MISTTASVAPYTSTASQTVFSYPFRIQNRSDLLVFTEVPGSVRSNITGSIVSVSGVDSEGGGTVTIPAQAAGTVVYLVRASTFSQLWDASALNFFDPATVERVVDKLTILCQEVKAGVDASIRFEPGEQVAAIPRSLRAGKILAFDSNGNPSFINEDGVLYAPGDRLTAVSVADLKAISLSGVVDRQAVDVLGYYAAGDGGGGLFYYDSASSETDNGGTILQPVTGSGRWKRSNTSRLSLKQWGCLGDGATDDTSRFLAAVNFGLPLLVTGGVFKIGYFTSTVTLVDLLGDMSGTLTLRDLTGFPAAREAWRFTGAGCVFRWENVQFSQGLSQSQIVDSGGYNDGTDPNTWGTGYWLGRVDGASKVSFINCSCSRVHRGFLIDEPSDSVVVQGGVFDCADVNIQSVFSVYKAPSVSCQGVKIFGPRFLHPVTGIFGGAAGNGGAGFHTNYCSNVHITGNLFSGVQCVHYGKRDSTNDTSHIVFCDNIVDNPVADTALFNWYKVVANNNLISESGDMGIGVDGSDFVTVCNNTIRDVMVGCIGINGCVAATCIGNSLSNPGRGYAYVTAFSGRYSSGGGAWLSGISISYQSSATGAQHSIVANNTLVIDVLPPVSDANPNFGGVGPIRAAVLGIFVQQTTGSPAPSVMISNNWVNSLPSDCPLWAVSCADRQAYYTSKTGTAQVGETLQSATCSLTFIGDYGSFIAVKDFVGATYTSDVLTGLTSGATFTITAGGGGLGCYPIGNVLGVNYDRFYNADTGLYPGAVEFQKTTQPSLPVLQGFGFSVVGGYMYHLAKTGGGTGHILDGRVRLSDAGWQAPLQLGTANLWVDGTGKLRLLNSAEPTSDTDGTIVGTQT